MSPTTLRSAASVADGAADRITGTILDITQRVQHEEERARFEEQKRQLAAGDEEAQPYDADFVRALEHGMPPAGGIGIGIDRLVMLLSGRHSIREVVLFPAMRREG